MCSDSSFLRCLGSLWGADRIPPNSETWMGLGDGVIDLPESIGLKRLEWVEFFLE